MCSAPLHEIEGGPKQVDLEDAVRSARRDPKGEVALKRIVVQLHGLLKRVEAVRCHLVGEGWDEHEVRDLVRAEEDLQDAIMLLQGAQQHDLAEGPEARCPHCHARMSRHPEDVSQCVFAPDGVRRPGWQDRQEAGW
jgi:hypothetical protein